MNALTRAGLNTSRNGINRVFDEMDEIQDFFSDFFDTHNWMGVTTKQNYPRLDIYNADDGVHIDATVPGLNSDDVKVEWSNGLLTISASSSSNIEDKQYGLREIHRSAFKRQISVPSTIYDVDNIGATVNNGLLHISIPNVEKEKPEVKQIEVK